MEEQVPKEGNERKLFRVQVSEWFENCSKRVAEKPKLASFFRLLPLSLVLLVALITRVLAAKEAEGFVHPDEVFQSLEMIHYRLFGQFGRGETIPWEFNEQYEYGGARSWFFVMLLATVYRFVMIFGITDPLTMIFAARLVLSLCSLTTVVIAYLFGRDIFNKKVGLTAAFLCATWWFFPFWASRTMTDSLASDLLFVSIYFVYKTTKESNLQKQLLQSFFAGVTLGFAFMLRFPSGLLGLPLLIFLVIATVRTQRTKKREKLLGGLSLSKRERFIGVLPILSFLGGTLIMILVQGLLDLFTWGDFLQSPLNFFMYNIIEGHSAIHGISPWYSYFIGFYTDFANGYILFFVLFLIIGLSFKEQNWAKIIYGTIFLFWLILFIAIPHKEFRFIFILLPYSMLFIANGIVKFAENFRKAHLQRISLVVILSLLCAASAAMAFYHQRYFWKANAGICNAMYWVGKQEDVQTVVIFEMVWYTGGYAYLNKNVSCFFMRINAASIPELSYNSTSMRHRYLQNGTYVIVREPELYLVQDILLSCNMTLEAIVGQLPNAYVFKQ